MSAELERLLRVGVKAVRSGNTVAARGLFRALAREYPDDPRVWLGLAGSASDRDEQRYALEHVLTLDPNNHGARNALARLDAALPPSVDLEPATQPPPPEPLPATAPAAIPTSVVEPQREPDSLIAPPADDLRAGHFPLLNRIALGVIGALALLLLLLLLWPRIAPQPQATPPPTALLPTTLLPTALATGAPAPTAPAGTLPTTAAADATAPPTTVTTPTLPAPTTPAATPTPVVLPLGAVIEVDGWRATLLRPDYALLLDGAIGELQPTGRFVLALMAVSNGAAEPRTLPGDLFTLTDSLQRSYTPLPNASSIYLATYGPEFGEQALEEPFAAQSGMLSIPLLFDVPPDADGFTLTLRNTGPGWPITGGDTFDAGP